MDIDRVARMEHFAFDTPLSLRALCARVRDAFGLPGFQFGQENETEWGWAEIDGIEYNVSRPYAPGTLHTWDDTVPERCTAALTLCLAGEHPRVSNEAWILEELVTSVGQHLSRAVATTVYHHRSWLGVARNVPRTQHFTAPRP